MREVARSRTLLGKQSRKSPVLRLGDKDLRSEPLSRRKSHLQKLLRKNDTLRYVDQIIGEDLPCTPGALALGLEGIAAKDSMSPYIEGPRVTWHWQKVKNKDYQRKAPLEFRQNKIR